MKLSKVKLNEDEIFKGDRVEIKPTDEIKLYLIKFDYLSRCVYNWGIDVEQQYYLNYKSGKTKKGFLSFIDLSVLYDNELKNNPDMAYLRELPLNTARESLKEVDDAYQMFFKGYNKVPKHRVKYKNHLSFRTRSERTHIDESGVRIEGLPPMIRIPTNDRRFDGYGSWKNDKSKLYNTGIIYDGYKYWFTFQIIIKTTPYEIEKTDPIGIDIGQINPAVTSDGIYYTKPDTKKLEKRIKHEQRHVARDRKIINKMFEECDDPNITKDDLKSKNMIKREQKLAKLQRKYTNIMTDFYYKSAIDMIKNNPSAVCIETIRPSDITSRFPSSHKYMHNIAMRKYSEIIQFEAKKHAIPVLLADKEFPSSQMCSKCGNINKNIGGHRMYICPKCGNKLDRDLNASINLKNLYYI